MEQLGVVVGEVQCEEDGVTFVLEVVGEGQHEMGLGAVGVGRVEPVGAALEKLDLGVSPMPALSPLLRADSRPIALQEETMLFKEIDNVYFEG